MKAQTNVLGLVLGLMITLLTIVLTSYIIFSGSGEGQLFYIPQPVDVFNVKITGLTLVENENPNEMEYSYTNKQLSDSDGDGWEDGFELINGYDPMSSESHPSDTDNNDDKICDSYSNYLYEKGITTCNLTQCNLDCDNDGWTNEVELLIGTNPCDSGSHGDSSKDKDKDGITDLVESTLDGYDENKYDSQRNGYSDLLYYTLIKKYDSIDSNLDGNKDSDSDNAKDFISSCYDNRIFILVDTDGDGEEDFYEILHSTDPYDNSDIFPDEDIDGIPDYYEEVTCYDCDAILRINFKLTSSAGTLKYPYAYLYKGKNLDKHSDYNKRIPVYSESNNYFLIPLYKRSDCTNDLLSLYVEVDSDETYTVNNLDRIYFDGSNDSLLLSGTLVGYCPYESIVSCINNDNSNGYSCTFLQSYCEEHSLDCTSYLEASGCSKSYECLGEYDCSNFNDKSSCENYPLYKFSKYGCVWDTSGNCFGKSYCGYYFNDQSSCESVSGCTWSGSICEGTFNCNVLNDEESCLNGDSSLSDGCTWNDQSFCDGNVNNCNEINDEDTCNLLNCDWTSPYCSGNIDCTQFSDYDTCISYSCTWDNSGYCKYTKCEDYISQTTCEKDSYCRWDIDIGCYPKSETICSKYDNDINDCNSQQNCEYIGGKCTGTSSCSQLTSYSSCNSITGCTWVAKEGCYGTSSRSCSYYEEKSSCENAGCTWSISSCNDPGHSCSSFLKESVCNSQDCCIWDIESQQCINSYFCTSSNCDKSCCDVSYSCSGEIDCSSFSDEDSCEQNGCTWGYLDDKFCTGTGNCKGVDVNNCDSYSSYGCYINPNGYCTGYVVCYNRYYYDDCTSQSASSIGCEIKPYYSGNGKCIFLSKDLCTIAGCKLLEE